MNTTVSQTPGSHRQKTEEEQDEEDREGASDFVVDAESQSSTLTSIVTISEAGSAGSLELPPVQYEPAIFENSNM